MVGTSSRIQRQVCLTLQACIPFSPWCYFLLPTVVFLNRLSVLTVEPLYLKVGPAFRSRLKKSVDQIHSLRAYHMRPRAGYEIMESCFLSAIGHMAEQKKTHSIKISVLVDSLQSHWVPWAKALCLSVFHMATISGNSLLLQHGSVFIFFLNLLPLQLLICCYLLMLCLKLEFNN